MKLKNIKIYLLVILSIFLLNTNTHAIDVNIHAPFPQIFFDNINKNPWSKKFILEQIINAIPKDNQKLKNYFNDMKQDITNVTIEEQETFIDNKCTNQCILIRYGAQVSFVNFISKSNF